MLSAYIKISLGQHTKREKTNMEQIDAKAPARDDPLPQQFGS